MYWSDRSEVAAREFQGQGRARYFSRDPRRVCLELQDASKQPASILGISLHYLANIRIYETFSREKFGRF